MKVTLKNINSRFPFQKYRGFITTVFPFEDMIGIKEISFVNSFSHLKSDSEALGIYLQGNNGKDAKIEVNIPNLMKETIPEYLFRFQREIAALWLSEIIAHEIGHHGHTFKRHGVRKKNWEIFSDEYAKAGYFNFLKSRSSKILSSYWLASKNFILFEKKVRVSFAKGREELIEWLRDNKGSMPFP